MQDERQGIAAVPTETGPEPHDVIAQAAARLSNVAGYILRLFGYAAGTLPLAAITGIALLMPETRETWLPETALP
jgi:hypothetical protein